MIATPKARPTPGDFPEIKKTYGGKWQWQRFMVWMRDDFRCVYCGQDLIRDYQTLHTATVDHLRPKAAGGGHGLENLVTACMCCNTLKGDKVVASIEEGQEIIAVRREKLMGYFVEMAREFGIQFPRHAEGPTAQAMAAYEVTNSLKAFAFHSERLVKHITTISGRVEKIEEGMDMLELFQELFERPAIDGPSPEEPVSV